MKCSIFATSLASLLAFMFIAHAESLDQIPTQTFVHPGMLHSTADLDRMKNNVQNNDEPWASAWKQFKAGRFLNKDYQPWPLEIVGRGQGSTGQLNISQDASAAYYNAIAWYISGDEAYAKKAVEIINAWSYKCKTINGKDAVLCAGIYGYKFVNAAEILRSTYKKWPDKDIEQFKTMVNAVFYPVIKDFATFANGNWDTCCLPTIMSIGIFCDDRAMFDSAVRYYMDGSSNGSLTHYIINEAGQCQESGRDQGHTQAGIGHLLIAAEIAYHQGIDLYGEADNRLLRGVEYTAKYNLGNDVPFEPYSDRTGKYSAKRISPISRGGFASIYEMAYNHYQNRLGIDTPFITQVISTHRPERSAIDHPGNGTLLFALPPYKASDKTTPVQTAPSMPGSVIVKGAPSSNALRWAPSLNATGYDVKRATTVDGPYTTIAKNIKSPSYADNKVEAGKLYYYVVSAVNAAGTSADTLASGASAGMPKPWAQQDVGSVSVPGLTLYDGHTFTLEGAGTDIGGTNDQFQFAYLPMTGDGTITARFVPQVPSQFAKMGLMMRETTSSDSAHASLIITPDSKKSVEIPNWSIRLVARTSATAETSDASGILPLNAPYATWGRLLEPYWLRLTRSGNTFSASTSPDGRNWTPAGTVNISLKQNIFVGLAACSRLKKVTTTVMFDNVSAPGWMKTNP